MKLRSVSISTDAVSSSTPVSRAAASAAPSGKRSPGERARARQTTPESQRGTPSSIVAVQFTQTARGYALGEYVDGNRNGVLAVDMQSGVDWRRGAIEHLPDQIPGVDFGAAPGLPAIDPGGTPPGGDPIRLGVANRASFSPVGTATPGTVYIRGRNGAQYAVRILGETGRTRIVKFARGRWRPI